MLSNHSNELQSDAVSPSVNLLDGFWLDNWWVLPNTGVLQQGGKTARLEPKVMDVLVALATNKGAVVSAECLFAEVWPNAIYSPIAIRRAINQLRNALHDNDKSLIKTHPKRGYALYAAITVEHQELRAATSTFNYSAPRSAKHRLGDKAPSDRKLLSIKSVITYFVLIGCFAAFYFLVAGYLQTEQRNQLAVSNFQPVTATPSNEYLSLFTPDNDALLYLKESGEHGLGTEIWLSALDKSSETRVWQINQHIHFATWRQPKDEREPKQLVFAIQQGERVHIESITFDNGYRVQTHQHHMAVAGRLGISSIVVVDDQVVFVAKHNEKVSVYKGFLQSGQIAPIYQATDDFLPYRITAASDPKLATVVGFDSKRHTQLRILNLTGGLTMELATLDSNWYFVQYAPKLAGYILSDGKRLLSLDSKNNLSNIPFEFYDFLHYPTLSPNAKQLSFTFATISGSLFKYDFTTNEATQLTHSTRHDWQGTLSPSGEWLAFISNRNGYSQVFVKSLVTGEERLVYRNPEQHLALSQPHWSPDETTLAFARNERLTLLTWRPTTPIVREYNSVVGVPRDWLSNDTLLLRRKSANGNVWLAWKPDTQQERVRYQGAADYVVSGNITWIVDTSQVRDVNGAVVFQASSKQQIMAHHKQADGLDLILSTAHKDTYQRIRLYSNGQAEQLGTFNHALSEVSDVNQDSIVFTVEQFQKDIVMLDVTEHTTDSR